MKDVFQWVRQRLTLQAEKRKEYVESSCGVKPHNFRTGDLILIRRQAPFPHGETPKLGLRFLGPFRGFTDFSPKEISPNGIIPEGRHPRTEFSQNGLFSEWTFPRKETSPKATSRTVFSTNGKIPDGKFPPLPSGLSPNRL